MQTYCVGYRQWKMKHIGTGLDRPDRSSSTWNTIVSCINSNCPTNEATTECYCIRKAKKILQNPAECLNFFFAEFLFLMLLRRACCRFCFLSSTWFQRSFHCFALRLLLSFFCWIAFFNSFISSFTLIPFARDTAASHESLCSTRAPSHGSSFNIFSSFFFFMVCCFKQSCRVFSLFNFFFPLFCSLLLDGPKSNLLYVIALLFGVAAHSALTVLFGPCPFDAFWKIEACRRRSFHSIHFGVVFSAPLLRSVNSQQHHTIKYN